MILGMGRGPSPLPNTQKALGNRYVFNGFGCRALFPVTSHLSKNHGNHYIFSMILEVGRVAPWPPTSPRNCRKQNVSMILGVGPPSSPTSPNTQGNHNVFDDFGWLGGPPHHPPPPCKNNGNHNVFNDSGAGPSRHLSPRQKNYRNQQVFNDLKALGGAPVAPHRSKKLWNSWCFQWFSKKLPKKLWKSPCLDDFGWSRTSGCLDACFSASKRRASLRPANIFHNLEIKENEWLWKPKDLKRFVRFWMRAGRAQGSIMTGNYKVFCDLHVLLKEH